jgi:pimeloyl-ACP methyl ester carboxylesterase
VQLTRSTLALSLATSLAALSLPGCGSNPGPEPATAPPASSAPPLFPSSSADAGAPAAQSAPIQTPELWEGKLMVGAGMQLRLVLHVTRGDDGALHGTLDSPDQSASGIPTDSVTRDAQTLGFTVAAIGASYSGKVNEAGTEVAGEFKQQGASLPLTLTKVAKVTEVARPQTPKPPFPYRSEDVTYKNPAGAGVTLAGTLTLPQGDGPFPAAILLTGSGAQDRDETLFGHKPFLVLADDLTRKGIAVLRVDDRGVGGSTGSVDTSTTEDFAADALAGIAYLKGRKEIDRAHIGLIGHSEGGLVAPLAATKSKDVAFIVLLAGPGLPGHEILLLQSTALATTLGMPEDEVKKANAVNKRLYDALLAAHDAKDAETKLRAIFKEEEASHGAQGGQNQEDAMVKELTSPWFLYFVKYDPRPILAKVKVPLLAIDGEKDLQVPPKENLAAIKKADPRATTTELPGLNHLFQTAKTGLPNEYGTLEETMSPAALSAISDFVLAHTKGKK